MSFKITHVDRGLKRLSEVAKLLASKDLSVRVGVLGEKAGEPHGAVTNAQLAAIHEYGAPAAGVPERSFIRSAFEVGKAGYRAELRRAVEAVYQGRGNLARALALIGQRMQSDIKRGVVAGDGIPPPLDPKTIARKGSDRPLVDTGQLLQSISYEVTS